MDHELIVIPLREIFSERGRGYYTATDSVWRIHDRSSADRRTQQSVKSGNS